MPRVSRKEAEKHREDVVEAAAKLFREHGINGVSVPNVMAEAGLTHGAFYGHFDSKEALAAIACAKAFEKSRDMRDLTASRHNTEDGTARREFIKRYTSRTHRDEPGAGCPATSLCGDIARNEFQGQVRDAFVAGLNGMADELPKLLSHKKHKVDRDETLATISMLVGAVLLSRATKGSDLSDEILQAVRATLSE